MKNLFDRHHQHLSDEEKGELWAVLRSRLRARDLNRDGQHLHVRSRLRRWFLFGVAQRRPGPAWVLPAGVAVFATAVLTFFLAKDWESKPTGPLLRPPAGDEVYQPTPPRDLGDRAVLRPDASEEKGEPATQVPPGDTPSPAVAAGAAGQAQANAEAETSSEAREAIRADSRREPQAEPSAEIAVAEQMTRKAAPAEALDPSAQGEAGPNGRALAPPSRPQALPPSLAGAMRNEADAEGPGSAPPASSSFAAAGDTKDRVAITSTESGLSPTASDQRADALLGNETETAPRDQTPPAAATPDGFRALARTAQPQSPSATDRERILIRPEAVSSSGAGDRGSANVGSISGRVLDDRGKALAYANVMVVGTPFGAFSRDDGSFAIRNLPPGTYVVQALMIGYETAEAAGVQVEAGQDTRVEFRLKAKPEGSLHDGRVTIMARREGSDKKDGTGKSREERDSSRDRDLLNLPYVSAPSSRPADELEVLVPMKSGVVAKNGELHYRGGRQQEVVVGSVPVPEAYRIQGTPVYPTTGGTTLPNDDVYDSMFFEHYGVNPFIPTDEDNLSTFAVDVDEASYTVMRRYIEGGHLPDKDAVRVEEFVNFFEQGYPEFTDTDFRILMDGAPSPFGSGYHLLRIGLKAREIEERDRRPANLVFVIDVSGSMAREDRLELVKDALHVLVDELRPDDRIGIVVYGSNGRILLPPTSLDGEDDDWNPIVLASHGFSEDVLEPPRDIRRCSGRERILRAIDALSPNGSTNAEEGLLLAYEMARATYERDHINRLVLCSDGVANVGRTGPESILKRVRSEADKGILLTTIGFGMGNYNDVLMEQLADKGDGNYYYVDDIEEADRVLSENLTGTLQVVAKDAKVQVEFDPKRVLRYRLLGFENRDVADRDFRNDKVDAGEIGAGHEVTALYEVKLAEGVSRGRMATVRLRYARPEAGSFDRPDVREIERSFDLADLERSFRQASPRFRLDAAVAEFAEILRHSYWAKESRIADVLPVARAAARDLRHDEAADEFVRIVERAESLSDKLSPEERERLERR